MKIIINRFRRNIKEVGSEGYEVQIIWGPPFIRFYLVGDGWILMFNISLFIIHQMRHYLMVIYESFLQILNKKILRIPRNLISPTNKALNVRSQRVFPLFILMEVFKWVLNIEWGVGNLASHPNDQGLITGPLSPSMCKSSLPSYAGVLLLHMQVLPPCV